LVRPWFWISGQIQILLCTGTGHDDVYVEVVKLNSRQRRADRKEWRYEVTIGAENAFTNYDAMFDWCVANYGNTCGISPNGWREKHGYIGTCWQFNNSAKAAAFALRWK